MNQPLVSIICLCYNHSRFVTEALQSVINQTYQNIEIIIVDDASADESVEVIQKFINEFPRIQLLKIQKNVGNCKAFNLAFALSKGDFIIDFATDDILMPERIQKGVTLFQQLSEDYGVNFTDAEWINESGSHHHFHSQRFPHQTIPQGNIYQALIDRYFICSPTVMLKRFVMERLNGYDEALTYEDFDFWIRSSREFKYSYSPDVLVKKRIVSNSMSQKQFQLFSKQSKSTYHVCQKIKTLNRTSEERNALSRRIKYEMRQCLKQMNAWLMLKYFVLLLRNNR